jgi:hypothetical protein
VEIENYYVKSLIGWTGGNLPLTESDLETAKQQLQQFHLIFISESMSSQNTSSFMQKIFQPDTWFGPGSAETRSRRGVHMGSLNRASNKGQSNNKQAYPELVAKQVCIVILTVNYTFRI